MDGSCRGGKKCLGWVFRVIYCVKINPNKFGAASLAASPLLINLAHGPFCWWLGVAFAAIGPVLIALETKPKTRRAR